MNNFESINASGLLKISYDDKRDEVGEALKRKRKKLAESLIGLTQEVDEQEPKV